MGWVGSISAKKFREGREERATGARRKCYRVGGEKEVSTSFPPLKETGGLGEG